MQSAMQSRERSFLEMAALAYGSALALALIILMSTARQAQAPGSMSLPQSWRASSESPRKPDQ